MSENYDKIIATLHHVKLLLTFKIFCDKLSDDEKERHDIKNILHLGKDKPDTLCKIFKSRLDIDLAEEDAEYMLELVNAFFNKMSFRRPIDPDVRKRLLDGQKRKCAFCDASVDEHNPVDHIVPFKYVGDELNDNYQILCKSCNSKKRDSMDYQIWVLLNNLEI